MNADTISKLGAPFPFEEVEAKIQVASKEKPIGLAVFYVSARAIQKRLDEVFGPFNWSNHYSVWHDNSQICGISVYDKERNDWVTKHDGAENSDISSVKGGLTYAFKRAAVLWGIGRYLYEIDGVWVDVEQRGKSSYIKDNQQSKLKTAYDTAVKRIFGTTVNQQTSGRGAAGNAGSGSANSVGKQHPPIANNNQSNQQPPTPSAPKAPQVPQNANGALQPPASQAPNTEQKPSANTPTAHDFTVHKISQAGGESQLLELCNSEGEIVSAYIKSGNPSIVVGSYLRNVKIEPKSNSFKTYNIITDYQTAA